MLCRIAMFLVRNIYVAIPLLQSKISMVHISDSSKRLLNFAPDLQQIPDSQNLKEFKPDPSLLFANHLAKKN